MRQFAFIKPDKFVDIQQAIGVLASEDFLAQLAEELRAQLTPTDLCGRFGGNGFLVLLERGTAKDVETWAEHVVQRIGSHVFTVDEKTLTATATVGLGLLPPANPEIGAVITDALDAARRGRELGGNQMYVVDKSDTDTRVQAYDKIWVKHIKSALMENRFRLVQQPIASLLGEDKGMFDVLVRMLDEQGGEVLPAEFIAAAERNDLMKNIDRWVIGASLSFAANRKATAIFVRVSKDTVLDKSVLPWLETQLKSLKIEPKRLCVQVTEELATQYVRQTKELADQLAQNGLSLRTRAFWHRPRSVEAAGRHHHGLHQDRRLADAGFVDESDPTAAREGSGGGRQTPQNRDRRGTSGRCQHHGGAVAARYRVHPGLLRECPGGCDHVGRVQLRVDAKPARTSSRSTCL